MSLVFLFFYLQTKIHSKFKLQQHFSPVCLLRANLTSIRILEYLGTDRKYSSILIQIAVTSVSVIAYSMKIIVFFVVEKIETEVQRTESYEKTIVLNIVDSLN